MELNLVVALAGVQRVEVGGAIDAKHDCLTVDHGLLRSVLERRLNDPRKALCPIVTATRDQAHAVAIALQAEAINVVLHFMKPIRAIWDRSALGRQAKLK
ncbi:hypothetical protein XH99_01120 [Bradyrhizobium nanningense]|uniref:Uncharacterized protein n=1 Tax=Bradyrhizobium nanningense TaxID=1325118 RepID=A0A4Q0SIK4_9BRAD|nr:hypothetical protein XH84_07080 [Bradyrhizobium nanningense]RXH38390.1 hypothetical protein XH99_01120 [Bradyrhizobium nanningense]